MRNNYRCYLVDMGVPKDKLFYIMGNPQFVANSGRVSAKESSVKAMMSVDQKEEKTSIVWGRA